MPEQAASPDTAWHAQSPEDTAHAVGSSFQDGLSPAAAADRLRRHGPNALTERRAQPWWLRLLLQFHAPLIYLLVAAGVVTLLLGDFLDAGVIFGVVIVNALVGFIEESRAVKAIDALSQSMRTQATVLRDGERLRLDAADLVVGDLVLLEPGDRVPADLRLTRTRELQVDESMLTGESQPVQKSINELPDATELADRANLAFAMTLVTGGTGEGLVVATADRTEVGRISEMIAQSEDLGTPLTRRIAAFSRLLLWIVLGVALLTFLIALWRGYERAEAFKAAVALAVGAIPEGLPAAVTIMLAVGVSRMARRRAIIRKLPAVEALGSTTVICSDKTGTLTQNQMTVTAAWLPGGHEFTLTGQGYDPAGEVQPADQNTRPDPTPLRTLLVSGALCNDAVLAKDDSGAWTIQGDPTEAALLVAALKLGHATSEHLTRERLEEDLPRIDDIPFESARQYMATLHARADGAVLFAKGSVERMLRLCSHALTADNRPDHLDHDAVTAAAAALASRGLRVLALAQREFTRAPQDLTHAIVEEPSNLQNAGPMTLLGLVGMLDPPREEAIQAVRDCQAAGIQVKMITGDHAITAATIAAMIGIDGAARENGQRPDSNVLTGAQMAEIPDDQLPDRAEATAVFARMTPEQKLRLVKALQHRGHIVSMTGDGVNDAPALRQADIGVAMGITGTEAAKDAADMVLADDNFASIEAAVEEGRSVFSNLTKFIVWTLPTNLGEGFVIMAAVSFGWALPIFPVHALYINMVTSVLLGIPLIFEVREPGTMQRPPRDPRKPLITYELFMRTGLVALLLCAGATGLFQWELARGAGEAAGRTAAVSAIVVGEIFYLFSSRALLRPAWVVPLFSNLWLWAGIAAMLTVQAAFAHAPFMNRLFRTEPLDAAAWARVFAVAAAMLVIVELEKSIRRKLHANPEV